MIQRIENIVMFAVQRFSFRAVILSILSVGFFVPILYRYTVAHPVHMS